MKLEVFEKILGLVQAQHQRSLELCRLGVDLINYEEDYSSAISLLFRAYYGEAGADWIEWYLYERDADRADPHAAIDANGEPICYDVPSLWRYVEEIRVSVDFVEYSLPKPKSKMSQSDIENFFKNFIK